MSYVLLLWLCYGINGSLVATLTAVHEVADLRLDSLEIDVTVMNTGEYEVSFLPWDTPLFGELTEDLFKVVDQAGDEVRYGGISVFRHFQMDESLNVSSQMVSLQPGEARTARVDLTSSYFLRMDGDVTISLRDLGTFNAYGTPTPSYTLANPITFKVMYFEEQEARFYKQEKKTSNWEGCSSSQRREVQGWISVAQSQSSRARSCTSSSSGPASGCASVFRSYFGAFSSSRYSTVRSCWNNINRNLPNGEVVCLADHPNCAGRDAWVHFGNRANRINLCSTAFGSSDAYGGLIMNHEQSHFTYGGCDTRDHVYGDRNSRNLASNDPRTAVQNADNYGWFGRNV